METKIINDNWRAEISSNNIDFLIFSDNTEQPIATTCQDGIAEKYRNFEATEANAKLICAAPELLQALIETQKLIEVIRQYMPKSIKNTNKFHFENIAANVINKAILKATN